MSEAGEMGWTYACVVLGNILQWAWQVLDAVAKGGEFGFGTPIAIVARIILSLIVGILIIASFWPKLKGIEKPYRFILAIAAGFFSEAFIGPPVGALTSAALMAIH